MTRARTARFGLLILALALNSPGSGSAAEAGRVKVRRAPAARAAKAATDRTAPDITATIVKPSPATGSPAHADEALPPPYVLPTTSRARVRACGSTWRDMKLAGTTGDDDWRDFAVKCFTAKDGPPPVD